MNKYLFSKLNFAKAGILHNFRHKISPNMLLSSSFWHFFGMACDTFFSHHFTLSVNVKVLVSTRGKNSFAICHTFLWVLTKRSDSFETLKFTVRSTSFLRN